MRFNIGKAIALAAIVSAVFAAPSQASVAHLVLNGTAGDYITGGHTIDNVYSSDNPLLQWNWAQFDDIGTAAAPAADYLSFTYLLSSLDDKYAYLDFSTRGLGVPMSAGTTYWNAERAAFASAGHPGLDIGYNHRGCNEVGGSFTVNRLSFNAGVIDQFSASFSQSCDHSPLMQGTFYYNARLTQLPPNEVPEPATLALLGLGLAGVGMARRRKRAASVA